jgi:hypothetical protein
MRHPLAIWQRSAISPPPLALCRHEPAEELS